MLLLICHSAPRQPRSRPASAPPHCGPTVIPALTGDYCPACAEVVLDMEEAERFGQQIREFNKQVNAAIVDPQFIAGVRKKL
ncbi:MAG: type II toxin-antitoxin system MqsA family antitoxin, partial [Rhodocyclaceae bacterium]|nr:type II toxin-antitoxin system MqsA family antitoxin [Rhodocyclaceae bacterium]